MEISIKIKIKIKNHCLSVLCFPQPLYPQNNHSNLPNFNFSYDFKRSDATSAALQGKKNLQFLQELIENLE